MNNKDKKPAAMLDPPKLIRVQSHVSPPPLFLITDWKSVFKDEEFLSELRKFLKEKELESRESFWFGINPINLLSPRIFPVSISTSLNGKNPKCSIFLRYKSDDENVHTAREDFDDNEEALKRDSQVYAIIMQRKEEK
jgi:hypothetical protein